MAITPLTLSEHYLPTLKNRPEPRLDVQTALNVTWDPSGIWRPLALHATPACAPVWPSDPLGAAGAWHARPYCPTV